MAFLFGDSFDFYTVGTAPEFTSFGGWTSATNWATSSTVTRFSYGKSIYANNTGISLTRSMTTSSSTAFCAFAMYYTSISGSSSTWYYGMHFQQGGTNQVSIWFRADGAIEVRRGSSSITPSGTIIATFTSAYSATSWTHWQVKVVFNSSTGAVYLRKNGDSSNTFSATGLNTMATANAYADGFAVGNSGSGSVSNCIDDLMVWDDSGANAPNDWVGDIRCYSLSPNVDTAQKDFSNAGTTTQVITNAVNNIKTMTLNKAYFTKFTPTIPGNISAINVKTGNSSVVSANVKVAIYAADGSGGGPGTLLGTGTGSTGSGTLTIYPINLSSSVAVVATSSYWVAVVTDTTTTFATLSTYGTSFGYNSTTYSTGFSGSPTITTNSNTNDGYDWYVAATISNTGVNNVNQLASDGDTTYNYSSTVGATDLFDISDLPATPSSVYAVTVRAIVRKSDTGSRSGATVVKSGSTTDAGSTTVLSTSYGALSKTYLLDPNTSAAWTASAVNALQVGYKVAA